MIVDDDTVGHTDLCPSAWPVVDPGLAAGLCDLITPQPLIEPADGVQFCLVEFLPDGFMLRVYHAPGAWQDFLGS